MEGKNTIILNRPVYEVILTREHRIALLLSSNTILRCSSTFVLQGNDLPHVSWDNYYDINIEHILPQTYQTNWTKVMEDYLSGKELSDDENWRAKKIIINTLGNLTIIKDAKNSELQNNSWEDKRERYKNGTFCEIKIAQESEWNGSTILNRGIDMLQFLMTMVPGLSLNEEQQKRMLFVAEKYFPAISE